MDKLSRTMQDAIHIVERLGFSYLWMDALCIIQDWQEDWLTEASNMGSVYSNALFTLGVAASEKHSDGIFCPRKASCLQPFQVDVLRDWSYRDRINNFGEDVEYYVFPRNSNTYQGARPKGPLDTRGWTLQEQLLSPRILYYGDGELFWDCLTISASESSPISASLLDDKSPSETWALKLLRKSIAHSADTTLLQKRLADVWKQVIHNYSARKLTVIGDKIIAMKGILGAVETIMEEPPIAGMWRTDLWTQLPWLKERVLEPSQIRSPGDLYPAPSWS